MPSVYPGFFLQFPLGRIIDRFAFPAKSSRQSPCLEPSTISTRSVANTRPASWIFRAYWSDQNHGTGANGVASPSPTRRPRRRVLALLDTRSPTARPASARRTAGWATRTCADAARELKLEPGSVAVAVVKATTVIVETPGGHADLVARCSGDRALLAVAGCGSPDESPSRPRQAMPAGGQLVVFAAAR